MIFTVRIYEIPQEGFYEVDNIDQVKNEHKSAAEECFSRGKTITMGKTLCEPRWDGKGAQEVFNR